MGKKSRDAEAVEEMREIAATLALHGDEVPQLATARTSLDNVLTQIDELSTQRSFHQFHKQNASQLLRKRLEEGSKITTVIRFTLKQHFGSRSEDLVKFGLQPFRGRSRKLDAPAPETPSAPEEPAAKSAETPASPATE
jgi:hypothetical protein